MEIRTVGVVGLGTMGAGIAEVFARGGLEVTAVEIDSDALARGLKTLDGSLGRAVAKGRLTTYEREEIMARVSPAQKYADLATADLVVEVVPERLEIKRQVFAELDQACRADTIIATNTSSLSVTTIAADSAHPGRVVGMHFFNPAPVMRLVEVVTTVLTQPSAAAAVGELARGLGKTPVQVTDRAGFIANALLLPYLNHAVRLLESGYATREDIDAAVTAGIGLPMGPLTLLDLIGLDTSLSVLEVLDSEFGGTRYRPAPLLRRLTDAGHVGRKSGRGFYDYSDQDSSPDAEQAAEPEVPGTITLIDAGDQALAAARALAAKLGVRAVRSADRPGLLVNTLLYPHLNDAVAMVSDGYATPEDIDSAMTLGCGYRHGPMRMLDDDDLKRVTGVLAEMHATYGDPAFVPSPLLVEYARARLRFLPARFSPPPGQ